jgi:hypothetical protein
VTLFEKRNKRFDGLIPADFAPRFQAISDEDERLRMGVLGRAARAKDWLAGRRQPSQSDRARAAVGNVARLRISNNTPRRIAEPLFLACNLILPSGN